MKRITAVMIGSALVVGLHCGKNQDLKQAEKLAQEGNFKQAIELYSNIITDQQDTKTADDARLALATIYHKQKNYENALKNLDGLSEKRQAAPEVQDILLKCKTERLLLEGIKSAAVEFRQRYVKEREVKHQEINYTSPVFSGPADSLFIQSGVKPPSTADLNQYRVEVTLTDDPLEPTKINIHFPDGSQKELVLNY